MEEGKGKELEMREETKLDPNESPYKKKKFISKLQRTDNTLLSTPST